MARLNALTELLARMRAGDLSARDELFASAYPELRRIARARLRSGGRGVMLDTTALVHESYLRFAQAGPLRAEDHQAFFAYAAQIMRSVIINSIREQRASKRGGDQQMLELSGTVELGLAGDEHTVLQIHDALDELAREHPRVAQVAQMRYFGGYTEGEIAKTLGVTQRTIARDWKAARSILAERLKTPN